MQHLDIDHCLMRYPNDVTTGGRPIPISNYLDLYKECTSTGSEKPMLKSYTTFL